MSGPAVRTAEIRAYEDGPLIVRGPFVLRDADGGTIAVRRRTVALCRCGRSRGLPFCDGTHKAAGFTTRCASGAAGSGSPPAA